MAHRGRPPLGQHFLRSEAVLGDILTAAEVERGDRVLEVGPGQGVLTRPLLERVGADGQVVAVEVDATLARALRQGAPGALRVVQADAVRTDLEALGPFDRIVSNLPYQISGPITARFLQLLHGRPWRRAVLLVQQEFGRRLLAPPGGRSYGRLSVYVARWCTAAKVRDVSPGCFDPPPQVESMVVRLDPHPAPPFAVGDERMWAAVVDGAFQQRRKMLRNSLPTALASRVPPARVTAALEALGVASQRPEQVDPAAFARLARALEGA